MRTDVSEPRPNGNWLAFSGRTSLLLLACAGLWLFAAIMWASVFSGDPDANHNPIAPLLYTGFAFVVTLSLRDRLRMFWVSRRRRSD